MALPYLPACTVPLSRCPAATRPAPRHATSSGPCRPKSAAGPFPASPLLPCTGDRGCSQRPAACPTPWPCWGFCNGSQAWSPASGPLLSLILSPRAFDPHVIFTAWGWAGVLRTCSVTGRHGSSDPAGPCSPTAASSGDGGKCWAAAGGEGSTRTPRLCLAVAGSGLELVSRAAGLPSCLCDSCGWAEGEVTSGGLLPCVARV